MGLSCPITGGGRNDKVALHEDSYSYYIPRIWRESRVVFISRAGRESYTSAKNFGLISLTSFILKTVGVSGHYQGGPLGARVPSMALHGDGTEYNGVQTVEQDACWRICSLHRRYGGLQLHIGSYS